MSGIRLSRLVVPAALGLMFASPARSQETQLFTWMGRVDRDVRLTIQPGNVSNSSESSVSSHARVRVNSRLPQQDGELRISTNRGRGRVTVIQQPNASNGYTAVVDIADPQGGADMYSLTGYWQPTSGRMYGNRGRMGRGRNGQQSGGEVLGAAPALHWSGDVNSGVDLVWRDGNVTQRAMNNGGVRNVESSLSGTAYANPNAAVTVSLRSGRGRVAVIQQPTVTNNYTTIIRIVDPQGGFGRYSLDAYWR